MKLIDCYLKGSRVVGVQNVVNGKVVEEQDVWIIDQEEPITLDNIKDLLPMIKEGKIKAHKIK